MSQYKQYPSFKVFSWSIQELNGLSYRSLQQEAKIHGIRAKQKKCLLLDALVKKFNEKQEKIKKLYAVLKIQMWWKNTLFIKHTIPTLKTLRLLPKIYIYDRYYVEQNKPYGTIRVKRVNFIQKNLMKAWRSCSYQPRNYIVRLYYSLYGLNKKLHKEFNSTHNHYRPTSLLPSKVIGVLKSRKERIRLNKLEEYIAHGHITIDNLENEFVKPLPGDKLKILQRQEERRLKHIHDEVKKIVMEIIDKVVPDDRSNDSSDKDDYYTGGMFSRCKTIHPWD